MFGGVREKNDARIVREHLEQVAILFEHGGNGVESVDDH